MSFTVIGCVLRCVYQGKIVVLEYSTPSVKLVIDHYYKKKKTSVTLILVRTVLHRAAAGTSQDCCCCCCRGRLASCDRKEGRAGLQNQKQRNKTSKTGRLLAMRPSQSSCCTGYVEYYPYDTNSSAPRRTCLGSCGLAQST